MRGILSAVVDAVNSELAEPPGEIQRGTGWGWWHLWHDREPWENWSLCYNIVLRRKSTMPNWLLAKEARDPIDGEWIAAVNLIDSKRLPMTLNKALHERIGNIPADNAHVQKYSTWTLLFGADEFNAEFVAEFADMITRYIEVVTPEVNQAYERGEFADGEEEEGEGEGEE